MNGAVFWISSWGVIAIAAAASAAFIAGRKNRDYSFWTAWSFLIPPAVLVLVMLPRNHGPAPKRPSLDEDDKHLY